MATGNATVTVSVTDNPAISATCNVSVVDVVLKDGTSLAERLKEERKKAGLTQAQLAEKIGTKKSYISRIENGHTDVQLSTLFKIFQGLGKRVSVTIL